MDTLEIVFPYILGSALSIRHRLRIHDMTRKPFFEITFLVLARMPFKMWKILTIFLMSSWSSSTPLHSSIFQVWDVTMSHMRIWVRDQALIVKCQRSRLVFFLTFSFIYLLFYSFRSICSFWRFCFARSVVSFRSFRWFQWFCFGRFVVSGFSTCQGQLAPRFFLEIRAL